mgnify:CR=1 FL=1
MNRSSNKFKLKSIKAQTNQSLNKSKLTQIEARSGMLNCQLKFCWEKELQKTTNQRGNSSDPFTKFAVDVSSGSRVTTTAGGAFREETKKDVSKCSLTKLAVESWKLFPPCVLSKKITTCTLYFNVSSILLFSLGTTLDFWHKIRFFSPASNDKNSTRCWTSSWDCWWVFVGFVRFSNHKSFSRL